MHRSYLQDKNITPELQLEISKIFNRSFVNWLNAKNKSDYSIFEPSLKEVIQAEKKMVDLDEAKKSTYYDTLISYYEEDLSVKELDEFFSSLKNGIVPLLEKIKKSSHKVRTDFLTRKVAISKQEQFTKYLLDTIGFDFNCGAVSTTEHPFTDTLGKHDSRITTHYYEDMFLSNAFSVIHEGGHAIFGQQQDEKSYEHYLNDNMTMGMHESVSRFFENRIGRRRSFIHLIYPKFKELFAEEFPDVSEEELYEGVNYVEPSLIRTEADELTYSLHIIIRYELEKQIMNGNISTAELPAMWNKLYKDYLGISPQNDKEGILQDVHWSSGFGYFPTYALGNVYNAMYINRMEKEIDLDKAIESNNFALINSWMKDNIFKKADYLPPKAWIKDITNRDLDTKDFIEYLTKKHSEIYKL